MVTESCGTSAHVDQSCEATNLPLQTSSSRCTQCSVRPQENARNLVVCTDGTSNQFGQNNTNVVKLFTMIDLNTTNPVQLAYYSNGIGTSPKSSHIFNRLQRAVSDKFDMAFAWNIEEIIKDAYGWLAQKYQEGDQIYLFGFSRGAYQMRMLAGMIHEVGLIRAQGENQIGMAYDHYEAIHSGKPKARQAAMEFKNAFSWNGPRVHFVGVWDTVSSVGLIRGDVFLSTSSSAAHACHFRHALALDERRVKFMPEYFHEMNSQTSEGGSKYIVTSPGNEPTARPASERQASTVSDNATNPSDGMRTPDVKEVWFAGSHSDVGGKNQAGNVSLLWMRQEAIASGLVLKPTDIVWVPDDVDLGTSDSMSRIWRAIEYMPIKHQVSFSGTGEDTLRWHRSQPRRIIPGQKIHASVLYANAYKPQATFGDGFDIPIIQSGLEDTELDNEIWETGLFDDTAAQELLTHLSNPQGVAPIYLDRLLFMLRFREGRKCVRNVSNWQGKLTNLIRDCGCAAFVRLATIVAYYEASCDPDVYSIMSPDAEPPQDVFGIAKKCLDDILAQRKYGDGPRVVALLRPLTKHRKLRECILTADVLETLVKLLDKMVAHPEGNFGRAMDGLTCLLHCEKTRKIIIDKLGANPKNLNASRLSMILKVEKPHIAVALRMMLTLARLSEARALCSKAKPRIKELASKDRGLVGLLAVSILLSLYNPTDREQLNIRNSHIRANFVSALTCLNDSSTDGQGHGVDPRQQIFRDLFGLGVSNTRELGAPQKKLIGELKLTVQKGDVRERTAATMTLLKLCETEAIRTYLCDIDLLMVFISQLQHKNSALLAAYALAVCLKYNDMKEAVRNNDDLPKNIFWMLIVDSFDDAVGHVEGFQIFGDFMQHDDLRAKIKKHNITGILKEKLGKGKKKEIRTSLICLEIFRFFDESGPWTEELVAKSLDHLRSSAWKAQKAGVTILSSLAQAEHGVTAIKSRIHEIVEMLLPDGYLPMQSVTPLATPESPTSLKENQTQLAVATSEATDARSFTLVPDKPAKPPSWMMGPACALCILGRNKRLRDKLNETIQYNRLKHLHRTGILLDGTDTSPWRVRTPNRTDVNNMLDKMVKVVDGGQSEESLMSIGDAVLPHIQHWDRLLTMLRNRTVAVASILPLLGISVVVILSLVAVTPIYLSLQIYGFFDKLRLRAQNSHLLHGRGT